MYRTANLECRAAYKSKREQVKLLENERDLGPNDKLIRTISLRSICSPSIEHPRCIQRSYVRFSIIAPLEHPG